MAPRRAPRFARRRALRGSRQAVGCIRGLERLALVWVRTPRRPTREVPEVRPPSERPSVVLATATSAILSAASPGSSPGEGCRGLLLLLWGARWAWGTRGLPQEVWRPLHRSVWVRRERLELPRRVSAAVSALGSGAVREVPSAPPAGAGVEEPQGVGERVVWWRWDFGAETGCRVCADDIQFCHYGIAGRIAQCRWQLPAGRNGYGHRRDSPLSIWAGLGWGVGVGRWWAASVPH